jgi:DNA-binding transcriptional MerR regulator
MLAPQKNRAGQRIYRRKDVEMVLRIRNLLYEEKFTIAGAKKKLMEEMRKRVGRPRQLEADEEVDSTAAAPAQDLGPQIRRALKTIKRDLEELLTMLTSDVSIKP